VFRDEDLPELGRMITALHGEDRCGEQMSLGKIRDTVTELSSHPENGTIVMFRMETAVAGYTIVSQGFSSVKNQWLFKRSDTL